MVGSMLMSAPSDSWKVRVLNDLLRCHSGEDTIGGADRVPGCHLTGRDSFVKARQGRIRAPNAIEVASKDAALVLGWC